MLDDDDDDDDDEFKQLWPLLDLGFAAGKNTKIQVDAIVRKGGNKKKHFQGWIRLSFKRIK